MREDLIDFPISDLWRDHYAAQDLTYASGRYPKRDPSDKGHDQCLHEWRATMQSLRDQLAEIARTHAYPHVKETTLPAPPKPSTFEE